MAYCIGRGLTGDLVYIGDFRIVDFRIADFWTQKSPIRIADFHIGDFVLVILYW